MKDLFAVPGQRPPGPAPGLPWRHLLAWHRHPLDFLLVMAHKYGDIVTLPLGRHPTLLLNHPHFMQQVLSSETTRLPGAQHLLHGWQLWAGAELHPAEATSMVTEANALAQQWQAGAGQDVAAAMASLALRVAGHSLFTDDPNLSSLQEPLHRLIRHAPLPALWRRNDRHAARARDELRRRLAPLSVRPRFTFGPEAPSPTTGPDADATLSLLLTAYLLPAQALTWAWYLLGQHPQTWERLRRELASTLGRRLPTLADLPHLHYAAGVISETLRLYPPLSLLTCLTCGPLAVGGYEIPAGATLLLSPWVLQHDPRYFSRPFAFSPERWQATPELHALPDFPWGPLSPDAVVTSFLGAETLLLLATLAQRCALDLPAGQNLSRPSGFSLFLSHGLTMIPVPME